MIGRLLKRWDVDPIQLKALLRVSLLLDLRSQRKLGGGKTRRVSPMVWSLFFYLWMGIMLSAGLVSRAPVFLYSLLCLAYAQVMSVFVVLLEFGDTLVHPDDGDILGTRPLSSRTYFWGKLLNLLVYVSVVGLALNIGPALVGMALLGGLWIFPLAYLPLALLACLASAALVVWIYTGLVHLIPSDRFKDMLAYLQAVFSFAVFFGYQLLPRMGRHVLQEGGAFTGWWIWLTPPAWFAGAARLLSGHPGPHDAALTALTLGSTTWLFAVAFRKISLVYSGQVARLRAQSVSKARSKRRDSARRSSSEPWVARHIDHPETRAGYQLTSAMMRSDRQVKMGVYPLLGMPLAFFVLAWMEGELANPLSAGGSAGGDLRLHDAVFHLLHDPHADPLHALRQGARGGLGDVCRAGGLSGAVCSGHGLGRAHPGRAALLRFVWRRLFDGESLDRHVETHGHPGRLEPGLHGHFPVLGPAMALFPSQGAGRPLRAVGVDAGGRALFRFGCGPAALGRPMGRDPLGRLGLGSPVGPMA